MAATKTRPKRNNSQRIVQRTLFDPAPVPAVKAGWKQPPPSERGPNWAATWLDPKQLGIEVDETILTRPRRRA